MRTLHPAGTTILSSTLPAQPVDDDMSAPSMRYAIRAMSLREQSRDTYRVVLFLFIPASTALLLWLMHWPVTVLVGCCAGMLPSLVAGTPSRMRIAAGDQARIEAWLSGHRHRMTITGWVPSVPRALYFDSQTVRCDGGEVIGPLMTLRALRRMLKAGANMSA